MRIFIATIVYIASLFAAERLAAQPVGALDVTRTLRATHYNCEQRGQCSGTGRTANGDRFDKRAMTCAHRTLPFGTRLRVCRAGKCVDVRVNDRGPAKWTGNDLDLTTGAAGKIGLSAGMVRVTVLR